MISIPIYLAKNEHFTWHPAMENASICLVLFENAVSEDAPKAFLSNVLKAVDSNLHLDKVDRLEISASAFCRVKTVFKHTQASNVLILGPEPGTLGLQSTVIKQYQVLNLEDRTVIFGDDPDIIARDVALKRQLWNAIKKSGMK